MLELHSRQQQVDLNWNLLAKNRKTMETSENKAGIPTPFHLFYAFQAYNKKPILSIQHSKPMLFFTHGKAHIALRACKPPPCARALCQRGTQFAFGLDVLKVFEFWIFEISNFFETLNFWIFEFGQHIVRSCNALAMTLGWPNNDPAVTLQWLSNDMAMTWQWPGNDLAMT